METIIKILKIGLIGLLITFSTFPVLYAQEKANNKKNKEVVPASQSDSKEIDHSKKRLNDDIEKTIENEKFLEQEHQDMHDEDVADHARNKKKNKNKHVTTGYGQIRSEEAQKKVELANTNLEHAEEALLRAEQKIADAKENLLAAQKNNELKKEKIKERQENIKKAEAILEEAKAKLKTDLSLINKKLQETNQQ